MNEFINGWLNEWLMLWLLQWLCEAINSKGTAASTLAATAVTAVAYAAAVDPLRMSVLWLEFVYTGLIQVKEEGWMGFSDGWQGCSEGFPKGRARGKSQGAALPARVPP